MKIVLKPYTGYELSDDFWNQKTMTYIIIKPHGILTLAKETISSSYSPQRTALFFPNMFDFNAYYLCLSNLFTG